MDIDFGKAAKDYGRYRAGFPEAFFERLVSFGIGVPGQCVLDLGRQCGAQVAQFDVDLARLLAEYSPAGAAASTSPRLHGHRPRPKRAGSGSII